MDAAEDDGEGVFIPTDQSDVAFWHGEITRVDAEKILVGEQTPMFFGSAMTNFGVELFLKHFLEIGCVPGPRKVLGGKGGGSGGSKSVPVTDVRPARRGRFSARRCRFRIVPLVPEHADRS